ncbi:MAG: polymorphic toxin type 50 domain-containing protein [Muricomes sp.]
MRDIPKQIDLWSCQMSELYNSLEGEIIRAIIKRISNGHTDILDWQMQAMKDLRLYNTDVTELVSKVTGFSEKEVERMFSEAAKETIGGIDDAVPYDTLDVPSNLDTVMRSYYNQCWSGIDNYVNQTLISTNYEYGSATTRAYTQVLNRTQALFNTGIYTLDEAMCASVSELAAKGIKSTFVDKGGHTWSMERYVRTVMQSTLSNTYNELRTSRMVEYGIYTVIVTSHMGARKACTRIQGNVVDLRPVSDVTDSEYLSIYDPYWQADYGSPGGHRGCNCKHNHIVFIPGVNTNNQPKYDEKENEEVRNLQAQQRRLERAVVKCKKNKMVSEEMGDSEGAKMWGRKIRGYQGKIRELVASNKYLARDYKREKVYTPLDLLLEERRKHDTIRAQINPEKYNRHVQGTKEYEDYLQRGTRAGGSPSYMTKTSDEMQVLLDGLLSENDIQKSRVIKDFDETIGVFVNQTTGEEHRTTRGTIHISKTGIHVVPALPRKRRE